MYACTPNTHTHTHTVARSRVDIMTDVLKLANHRVKELRFSPSYFTDKDLSLTDRFQG